MRAILIICIFSLIHNGQSYRIVPKHIESGPVHSLQVFFSTQINLQTRTVLSTVTQIEYHTCYTTEPEIAECQKKRELGESTNENEDLILSDPKVEVNGVAANWENIISPSRVARNLEENVEEVYPTDVQVVQPAQREPAAVVYPSTVVESEPVKSRHEEDQEIVDNADEHVDDDEADLDEEATTISVNKHLVYSAGSDEETTTIENLEEEEEEEIETTTILPVVVVEADAAREAPEVSDSLDEQWELKEIALKMNGRSSDTCFDTNEDGGLFFTIFSTIYTTITEYQTEMETETNTVLFKSSGGCVPTDVHEMFTATCS